LVRIPATRLLSVKEIDMFSCDRDLNAKEIGMYVYSGKRNTTNVGMYSCKRASYSKIN